MDHIIGQTLLRYRILEQIGAGGMALVFKAEDTHLDSLVAVKILQPGILGTEKFIKRFEREAKTLARLSHPNIVRTIDYGQWNGMPFLVMPYLSGGTLKERTGTPMPYLDAARLLTPIAHALHSAHLQGIVHRDVKPSNILLTEHGDPLLSDFGIARLLENEQATQLTVTGMGVGTPDYMAPETWDGKAECASDQYALGVVFYEFVTGRRPFTAVTPTALMRKHVLDPLPPAGQFVPGLPREVEALVTRSLAKKAEQRYADMSAMAQALSSLPALPQSRERRAGAPPVSAGNGRIVKPFGTSMPRTPAPRTPTASPALIPEDLTRDTPSGILLVSEPPKAGELWGRFPTLRWAILGALILLLIAAAAGLAQRWIHPAGEPQATAAALLNPPLPSATLKSKAVAVTAVAEMAVGETPVVQNRRIIAPTFTATSPPRATPTLQPSPSAVPSFTPAAAARALFQPETYEDIQTVYGYWASNVVNAVAFSPDSTLLAAACDNKTIYLWEIDLETRRTLTGHTGRVRDIAFSPDGKTLASVSDDRTVRFWDLESGLEAGIVSLEEEVSYYAGVKPGLIEYVSGGKSLAVGSSEVGFIIDVAGKSIAQTVHLKEAWEEALGSWPNSFDHTLYDISSDGQTWLLDNYAYDAERNTWTSYNDQVWQSVTFFNPDETKIYTEATIWNFPAGTKDRKRPYISGVKHPTFSADGRYLYWAENNDYIVYDPANDQVIVQTYNQVSQVTALAASPDRTLLAVAHYSGSVVLVGQRTP